MALHIDALAEVHARCAEQSSEPLEPHMRDLLRLHSREEAHHLRLDRLLIDDLIERSTSYERERAIQQYLAIVDDLHVSFGHQADLDRRAFEAHTRTLQPAEPSSLRHEQALSYSTTFLHGGLARRPPPPRRGSMRRHQAGVARAWHAREGVRVVAPTCAAPRRIVDPPTSVVGRRPRSGEGAA